MISKKADYEGWTNWETWNVALLIDNEERSSNLARLMAKKALVERNRGQLNLDELTKQFAKVFARQERQVKKYHADMAADAREERGKYESKQLEGKPGLSKEEIAALPSEEQVKYISDQLGGVFYDIGGTSDWEKPMEPVNWKEIAVNFLDNEQNESEYHGETPEVNLSDADKAKLKTMGITGNKRAMITSDTQLETVKPVPAGEAPKDDIGVNSHPANENGGGAPVLDGELHQPERPNVNAMREAIEAQSEMEVGTTIEEKQEEVKAETEKGVSVEKGSGTQIIINIAGRRKTMGFSNRATAAAFVKGASAKFGGKFEVVALFDTMKAKLAAATITLKPGDRISWHFHQFDMESRHGIVTHVLPEDSEKLAIFDAKLEDGRDVWGYMGLVYEINGQHVKPVEPYRAEFEAVTSSNSPQQDLDNNAPVTSGISDINAPSPAFKDGGKKLKGKAGASLPPDEYKLCFQLARELGVSYGEAVTAFLRFSDKPLKTRYEYARQRLQEEAAMAKSAGFNYFFPGQVLQNFYPELMHETLEYPNATNAPMPAQMTGDAFEVEPGQLDDAVDDAFAGLSVVSYVSTSPAGGMGIARDGKPQVLEGAPLRKENDIRGPMFTDEFYQNYQEGIPGSALAALKEKVAGADEKKQFSLFLKRVMGEVAASFIAAFKVTSRMPMNKVPGVGELNLAFIEQPPVVSGFNTVNTGSRVKYLVDKLTDSEIQDAINGAWSQGAVWHKAKEGSFVYEVFARAETLDTESLILKYKFITGTREAE